MPRNSASSSRAAAGSRSASTAEAVRAFYDELNYKDLVFIYASMKGVAIENFRVATADQLRGALLLEPGIDVEEWKQRVGEWRSSAEFANFDWSTYPEVLTTTPRSGGAAATAAATATAAEAGAHPTHPAATQVTGVLLSPGGAHTSNAELQQQQFQQIMTAIQAISARVDAIDARPKESILNETGRKRSRMQAVADRMVLDSASATGRASLETDDFDSEEECRSKKGKTPNLINLVQTYLDGTSAPNERQRLLRVEMRSVPTSSIGELFAAVQRIGGTLEVPADEKIAFAEMLREQQEMVAEMFRDCMQDRQFLSAGDRDMLERRFTSLIKSKLVTKKKEFNFVDAAATAMSTIMADNRGVHPPRQPASGGGQRVYGGSSGGGVGGFRGNKEVKCFECGGFGHKSFQCTADEATRSRHKESRLQRQPVGGNASSAQRV